MSGLAATLDRALERLDLASERLSVALSRVAAFVTLPALMVFVSVDVAMRYLFDSPIRWAADANGLLLLVTVASALPYAWDRGYHIRMEIVYARLRGRSRQIADVTAATVGAMFFVATGIQALRFTPYMARTQETGQDLLIPVWPFMAYMGLCMVLLAVRLVVNPEMRPPGGARKGDDRAGVDRGGAADRDGGAAEPDDGAAEPDDGAEDPEDGAEPLP